jgi:hypothetical protein
LVLYVFFFFWEVTSPFPDLRQYGSIFHGIFIYFSPFLTWHTRSFHYNSHPYDSHGITQTPTTKKTLIVVLQLTVQAQPISKYQYIFVSLFFLRGSFVVFKLRTNRAVAFPSAARASFRNKYFVVNTGELEHLEPRVLRT